MKAVLTLKLKDTSRKVFGVVLIDSKINYSTRKLPSLAKSFFEIVVFIAKKIEK